MEEASLAAMVAEIMAEPASVCGMSKRIGKMVESQLEIYVEFLEKRRQSQVENRHLREAIGTILEEARRQLSEKRAENADIRERRALLSRRMEEQREKDELDLMERQKVMECVVSHCRKVAANDIRGVTEESRRQHRKRAGVRERRARLLVRIHLALAACLVAFAVVVVATTVQGDVAVLASGSSLAFVLVIISVFVVLFGRSQAKALRAPWREDESETRRQVERRAEDLMMKWENEQERVRRDTDGESTCTEAKDRRPSLEERVARAKKVAKETRQANARRRRVVAESSTSKVHPQGDHNDHEEEDNNGGAFLSSGERRSGDSTL